MEHGTGATALMITPVVMSESLHVKNHWFKYQTKIDVIVSALWMLFRLHQWKPTVVKVWKVLRILCLYLRLQGKFSYVILAQ